jgi:hypothetical protein
MRIAPTLKIASIAAIAAAAVIALTPFAQSPNPGDQCMNWHATVTGPNGQTMTCTHLPDSGHIMYWEYGGPRDT